MKKLTLLVLLTIVLIKTSNAQSQKFEINVYFMPDSLELPTNINKVNSISEISRSSKGIIVRLSRMNPRAIKRAFPDFSPSDTLFIRDDGKKIKVMNLSRIFTLEFNSEEKALDAIEKIQQTPGVLFAEPNWGVTNSSRLSLIPDSEVQDQWHLNNTGQNGGSVDADIDAFEAWQIFPGGSSVKVAIIDTGVDKNQIDLSSKTTGDNPPSSVDTDCVIPYSHGTHIAGIIGASIGEGVVRGVASNASLISKNIYNNSCDPITSIGTTGIFNKITEAINEGASVINFSSNSSSNLSVLNQAFIFAYQNGMVNVNSMGNIDPGENQNSSSPEYPSAYFSNGMIQVGNSDQNDIINPNSRTGDHIDIVAPGTGIVSTWTFANNDDAISRTGTSQAAAVVSGMAALIFEHGYQGGGGQQYLFNDDVENIIKISADKVPGMNGNNFTDTYGYGRANLKTALDKLRAPYNLDHYTSIGGGYTLFNRLL